MKICPKCKMEYDDDNLRFCKSCGTELTVKEGWGYCQFCGAPMEVDATFCSQCGRRPDGSRLTDRPAASQQQYVPPVAPHFPPPQPKISIGEKLGKGWTHFKTRLGDNWTALKADKKKLHTVLGVAVAIIIAAGAGFYTMGPTEHYVQTLAAAKDSAGLVKLVAGRAHSSFFADVTNKAVKEIIKINKKEDINSLSQYVIDKNANVDQKKAIITAFTEKDMVVPYFYKVFESAGPARNLVIENGTKQNPDIFKDKMYADMDGILDQCRNDFGDYDAKIEHLKIYNVGDFVPAAAFDNLKSITKLYTIQQAVKTDNNDTILQALDLFKTMKDSNLVAKNAQFFNQVATKIQDKKTAIANVQSYNTELAGLNTEQKVAGEQRAMQGAKDQMDSLEHINYFCHNYMNNGKMAVIIPGEGWAVISNPPEQVNRNAYYSDYVKRLGNTTIYDNYRTYNVSEYELRDVTPLLNTINAHQRNIDAFYAQEQEIKNKINAAIANREAAGQEAGELMNGMLIKLNNIKSQDLIAFSSGKAEPPTF
jgi:hypothetical protein